MISFAPTAGHENASPQALAWNIGTTASTVSFTDRPMTSVCRVTRVWMKFERCE